MEDITIDFIDGEKYINAIMLYTNIIKTARVLLTTHGEFLSVDFDPNTFHLLSNMPDNKINKMEQTLSNLRENEYQYKINFKNGASEHYIINRNIQKDREDAIDELLK